MSLDARDHEVHMLVNLAWFSIFTATYTGMCGIHVLYVGVMRYGFLFGDGVARVNECLELTKNDQSVYVCTLDFSMPA